MCGGPFRNTSPDVDKTFERPFRLGRRKKVMKVKYCERPLSSSEVLIQIKHCKKY